MKHVVGFSGGIASSVVAKLVHDEFGDDTVLLFHDTHTEPIDNERFRQEVAAYIGLPITEYSDGRDIWGVFSDHGFLGNGRKTPCSSELKQKLSLEYLQDNDPATLYIGFTLEEVDRAQRTYARYLQYDIDVRFPLIEQNLSKEECMYRVKNCWGIEPPEMYAWAEHANCIPCIKGGLAYWGMVYIHEREAWNRASVAEKEYGHRILTKYGSLEDELNNCINLAHEYIAKRDGGELQESLFEFPCECMVL